MARKTPTYPAASDDEGRELLARFEARYGAVKRKRTTSDTHKMLRKPPELSAEQAFAQAWEARPLKGATMVRELAFHPERKWRFDFAWPDAKLALEVDGFGRHQTFAGYREDTHKGNAALLLGWRVLHVVAADKDKAHDWVDMVKAALCGLGTDLSEPDAQG